MAGATVESETSIATVNPAYDIVGTGDYNGDGQSDILWRHTSTGDVWVWLMDGTTRVSMVYVDTVDPGYVVKGSGDVNADFKADIVWHHATTGEVWVWPMNGTSRLDQAWVGTVPDTGYQIREHRGLHRRREGGPALVAGGARGGVDLANGWRGAIEEWVGAVPETDYRILGLGDYDGDRKSDLLWHHATRGEVWVWLMDGATPLSQMWVGTVADIGYLPDRREVESRPGAPQGGRWRNLAHVRRGQPR